MKNPKAVLAGKTREEKLELLEALEEKKRRSLLKPGRYVLNEAQAAFHRSEAAERFLFSANGVGKSAAGVNEVHADAMGWNPWRKIYTRVPHRGIFIVDKPDKIAQTFIKEYRKWNILREDQLHKDGKPYVARITWDNGSDLRFMTHDMDPLSFESIEVDTVYADEPFPRFIYIALVRGQRTKGSTPKVVFMGTPIGAAWLREMIWKPWKRGELPDTECFRFGIEVNRKNLADGYIERFSAKLTEKEKNVRLMGEFDDIDGLALAHLFNRDLHIVPRRDSAAILERAHRQAWPCVVAVDPHPSKPVHALMVAAAPDGRIYALKEWKEKITAREWAEKYFVWAGSHKVVDIVVDSLGNSDMTGGEGFASFIQVIRSCGVKARGTTYKEKSEEEWVDRIQDLLTLRMSAPVDPATPQASFQVLETCRGLITDIEEVEFQKIRHTEMFKPRLDISNKDFLSCLKYALATNIQSGARRERRIGTIGGIVSWNDR